MASSYLNNQTEIYFLHGTSINSTVWNQSVVQSIGELFGYNPNRGGYLKLVDWSGANNTKARKDTCEGLLKEIDHRKNKLKNTPRKITLVGHSHGGSIVLHASKEIRDILGPESQINILSLNTPNVIVRLMRLLPEEVIIKQECYSKTVKERIGLGNP